VQLFLGILAVYGISSLIAFFVYWFDKRAARGNRRRVPEKTLHLCGLLAGWPGGLLAQQMLRHKNYKKSFQVVFWITVVLNLAALAFAMRVFNG